MAKEIITTKKEKEAMAKVYREYSRQRYTNFKAQYPKMRQSDIVSKIIKEWEALSATAKENLQKKFQFQNYLTKEDIEESSSSKKQQELKEILKKKELKAQTIVRKSYISADRFRQSTSGVKVFVEKKERRILSEDGSRKASEAGHDESGPDSDSAKKDLKKTKQISKKNEEYITFFKHYYEALSKEHPRWLPNQITTIIKLLWKKRGAKLRAEVKRRINRRSTRPRKIKILSARRYFRRIKKLSAAEALMLWVRLPYESRKNYEYLAKGELRKQREKSRVIKVTTVKHEEETKEEHEQLGFLNKKIIRQ